MNKDESFSRVLYSIIANYQAVVALKHVYQRRTESTGFGVPVRG
jgi:hypothetical protein